MNGDTGRQKRCFVISPIGDERSPERKHADVVFRFIIEPAMERFGIEPIRSDAIKKPGLISEQMWEEIRRDDLCVAVITGHNPNVFYELAVAQALGRPVVILADEKTKIPFDIQDLRVVRYDMDHMALFDGVHANKVADHVEAMEADDFEAPSPIGDGAVATGAGQVKFFVDGRDLGGDREWLKFLEDTQEVFEIMGVGLNSWRKTEGFHELVVAKANAGCKVRVLLMHQDNPALPELNRRTAKRAAWGALVATIDEMNEYFSGIASESANIELRHMRHGCLYYQLTRSDHYAVGVQYFYSLQPGVTPAWQCAQATKLYEWAAREFDTLWQVNAPNVEEPSGLSEVQGRSS